MPNKKIGIEGIDSSTGKLILSDGGRTVVRTRWNNRKITWEIVEEDSTIKSFRIVGKTAYNPFEESSIPADYNTDLKLKVRKPQSPLDWEYSIYWKDEHNNVHISDPKISIDPSRKDSKVFLILGLVTFFLSLFSISWFLREKKRGK
jgi:hypothetical protein